MNAKQKQFMSDFSKDYSEESEKPLLVPRNNENIGYSPKYTRE